MDKIVKIVEKIVSLLVEKKYNEIEKITNGNRLKKQEIENAINEYKRKLIYPPVEAYKNIDVIQVENAKEWSVRFNLWTFEEGKSDLSIELNIIEINKEIIVILDNIIVF
jgi:hypothetical protein